MTKTLLAGMAMALAMPLALSHPAAAEPVETEAILASTPAPLRGSLLTPAETRAAAVIIPGSGAVDRNGDAGTALQTGVYRLLAEGLAADGIATVRIDKRGNAASMAAGLSEAALRFENYVADGRAWAAETARLTGRPCAWIIGHSEGALVALAAAVEAQKAGEETICGVVMVSGAGRPAHVVVAEQMAVLPEPLKAQALHALAELGAGRETPSIPGLEALFRPSVQPYLISWFRYDPGALMAEYRGPVLVAQGTTDLQTSVVDAETAHAANPSSRLVLFEGVNHVLKTAPIERPANLATYTAPDLPLAPGVAEAISGFILEPR